MEGSCEISKNNTFIFSEVKLKVAYRYYSDDSGRGGCLIPWEEVDDSSNAYKDKADTVKVTVKLIVE
jgi:hypothetical protein